MSDPRDLTPTYTELRHPLAFRSYFRTIRHIFVEPEAFFRAVRGGSIWGPMFFVLITYSLVSVLTALLENPELGVANVLIIALIVVGVFVLTPITGVFGTFLGALIWHPFVAISIGIRRGTGFRETFQIGAYQLLPS